MLAAEEYRCIGVYLTMDISESSSASFFGLLCTGTLSHQRGGVNGLMFFSRIVAQALSASPTACGPVGDLLVIPDQPRQANETNPPPLDSSK
jgi:hypothetical protein